MWDTKRRIILNILFGLVIVFVTLSFYSTFSMDTDYLFESDVYVINDDYIDGVSVNTDIELFYKYFDVDNCSIKVMDENNKEITSGYVTNGSKTILYGVNGNVIGSYINVIKGDYNRDGIIDATDFYDMGKCLIDRCHISDYELYSVDIDDDGSFNINDLVLLDKTISLGYTGLTLNVDNVILQSNEKLRVIANVMPSYGLNKNVIWSSLDENIVTIAEDGTIIGGSVGETKIIASTVDGKYKGEVGVKIDNTIQLSSYDGIGYVGGNNIEVDIKSVDYDDITCLVGDEKVASCEISDKKLIIKSISDGSTVISINSLKYGDVTYNLRVKSIHLNIIPNYLCMTPGASHLITVSPLGGAGELRVDISDKEVVVDAYMYLYNNRNMLRIDAGKKQGRSTLKVTECNANAGEEVVIDVSYMTLSDFGKEVKVGEEAVITANGHLGTLSCKVNDDSMGTCRVEGNKIIATPLKVGAFWVDVYNKFVYEGYNEVCGQSQFTIVAREE